METDTGIEGIISQSPISRRLFFNKAASALFAADQFLSEARGDEKVKAPRIVSRIRWKAREPRDDISTYEQYGLTVPNYTKITLHNTARGPGIGVSAVQDIQNNQMDKGVDSDIAYNFVIDSYGNIFQGRLLKYVPAHAGQTVGGNAKHDIRLDPDYGNIGIAFLASSGQPLEKRQELAAIELIRYLKTIHPITKVLTHAEIKYQIIEEGLTPEGDYNQRICPGFGTVENIVNIRRAVDPQFNPMVYRRLFQ